MNPLEKLLQTGQPILLDGAMGTMLMDAGLEQGDPPEEWNVTHPDRIRAVHRAYIQAGSRVILTNSFGGTRFRLEMHALQERTHELNKAAALNARAEAEAAPGTVVVAGSMGPTGQLFEPMGTMTFEEAKAAFAEQAQGLAEGGVDVFWIETMSDLNEVKAAVEGARSVSDLPIVTTMSFDTHGHTMMGVSPVKALESLGSLDVFAIGANCGTGSDELEVAVRTMRAANPECGPGCQSQRRDPAGGGRRRDRVQRHPGRDGPLRPQHARAGCFADRRMLWQYAGAHPRHG